MTYRPQTWPHWRNTTYAVTYGYRGITSRGWTSSYYCSLTFSISFTTSALCFNTGVRHKPIQMAPSAPSAVFPSPPNPSPNPRSSLSPYTCLIFLHWWILQRRRSPPQSDAVSLGTNAVSNLVSPFANLLAPAVPGPIPRSRWISVPR